MNHYSRRNFLKTSSGFLAGAVISRSFHINADQPLLAFSTLGCPDWTFDAILNFAAQHKYQGLEIRGLQRQMDLTKCPEFSNKANIAASRNKAKDHQVKFVDLGSSAELHQPEGPERQKQLDAAKRFIDLAEQLQCPYIRVFPNKLPQEREKQATLDLIAAGLRSLGEYAKGSSVRVLMETHGDVVHIADIRAIIEAAAGPQTGLVWDMFNMWSVTKEPPAEAYAQLKNNIYHTHIKDGKFIDGKIRYTLLGKGESPVFEALDLLKNGGYSGYYSFEWEKMWHPEIEEPEIALADYPRALHEHFTK